MHKAYDREAFGLRVLVWPEVFLETSALAFGQRLSRLQVWGWGRCTHCGMWELWPSTLSQGVVLARACLQLITQNTCTPGSYQTHNLKLSPLSSSPKPRLWEIWKNSLATVRKSLLSRFPRSGNTPAERTRGALSYTFYAPQTLELCSPTF